MDEVLLQWINHGQQKRIGKPTLIWILFYDVELDPIMVADVVEAFGNKTNDWGQKMVLWNNPHSLWLDVFYKAN